LGKDEKPEAVAKQKFTEKIMMIDPIEPMELRDYKNPPLPDKVTAIMSDGCDKQHRPFPFAPKRSSNQPRPARDNPWAMTACAWVMFGK
ncbi:MAG: hypothetical protein N3A53_08945, partial [Verrucomicrobiae bacterium]|nr:hypothetical protein [Verrucomicrobiae bacterium]